MAGDQDEARRATRGGVTGMGGSERMRTRVPQIASALVLLLATSRASGAAPVAAKPLADAKQLAAGKKLLDQAITAAGGAKALAAINDVTQTGSLTATMAEQDVAGTVTMIETRDGSTRDQLSVAGFEMISVAGPAGGYTSQAGISKTLAGNDLVQAQAQSRFTPLGLLLHGGEPGVVLRGLASEEDLDVLEVDPPGADPLTFYLDPKTHLVTKLKLVSSKEGTTLVTRYGLYRPEAGVQLAHQLSLTQSGLAMVLTFTNVQINAGVAVTTEAGAKTTEAGAKTAEPAVAAVKESKAEPENLQALSIINKTGKTLGDLYLSEHDKKEWGADLLPVDRFHDGDTATIRFRVKTECTFDLMITDVEGHYWIAPGANLCTRHTLTLKATKTGVTFDAK
jgi:hypothetical protein